VPDAELELAAFDDYYGGRPRNDGVLLRIIPDDTMRGLELLKGMLDLDINDLAPDIVHQLRRNTRLRTIESPGTDYQYIGLNLRDPVLRDRRVRQALAYAIDVRAIVQYLRRGMAAPAVGVMPPMSWVFNGEVPTYPYDPDQARRLLDEAGYPDPDGPGPQVRLTLSLKVSNQEFNRLQSAVIQENLRAVGIGLDVRMYEFATLYADVLKGDFQMFTLQWTAGGTADPDILRRVFHSQQTPPLGFNRGYFANADVDQLLDEATVSTDVARRKDLFGKVQEIVAREARTIEGRLSKELWIVGANYSATDMVIFPWIQVLRRALDRSAAAELGARFLPMERNYPALARWIHRIEALPGYERTYPPHWRES
jgi:peptide/nickel transport system substrate-binding protein